MPQDVGETVRAHEGSCPEGSREQPLRVFISYSRRDLAFADRLVAALEARGFVVVIDRRDLPTLVEWERELLDFIQEADTVVFVVSSHSVSSRVCQWEVEQVRNHGKRLAPVVIAEVDGLAIPDEIARVNYLHFTGGTDFEVKADELAKALNTDVDWLKEHTRIGQAARRWEVTQAKDGAARAEAMLLRGDELAEAELWVSRRPREAPEVTDLHRAFVQESRKAEQARAEAERVQLARTSRFQQRSAWALGGVAAVVASGLAAALWQSRETEKREAIVAASLAHREIENGEYEKAMRIALQRLPARGRPPSSLGWEDANIGAVEAKLAGAAQLSPLLVQFIGHKDRVQSVAFSPDGARIITGSRDGTARVWDAVSGAQLLEFRGGSIYSAVFSPDGARIVTASADGTVRVRDAGSGAQLLELKRHGGEVLSAAFSPDGSRIVTASDNKATVWDARSGAQLLEAQGSQAWKSDWDRGVQLRRSARRNRL